MFDKYIQVMPTLTEAQAKAVIAEAEEVGEWKRASTYKAGTNETYVNDARTNMIQTLGKKFKTYPMVKACFDLAFKMYPRYVLASIPSEDQRMPMPMTRGSLSTMDGIGILKYQDGEHYKWHADAYHDPSGESHTRTISVVCYLNNDFEGGATEFIDGPRKAPVGHSLFFPSNWCFRHAAQPVTKGTKYALVTWYRVFNKPKQPKESSS